MTTKFNPEYQGKPNSNYKSAGLTAIPRQDSGKYLPVHAFVVFWFLPEDRIAYALDIRCLERD